MERPVRSRYVEHAQELWANRCVEIIKKLIGAGVKYDMSPRDKESRTENRDTCKHENVSNGNICFITMIKLDRFKQ